MTEEEVKKILSTCRFTFARTLARTPHSWICRKDWKNDNEFLELMDYIEKNGKVEYFFKHPFTYLYLGEYKYWVMTDKSGKADRTAIINRAKKELSYG